MFKHIIKFVNYYVDIVCFNSIRGIENALTCLLNASFKPRNSQS